MNLEVLKKNTESDCEQKTHRSTVVWTNAPLEVEPGLPKKINEMREGTAMGFKVSIVG